MTTVRPISGSKRAAAQRRALVAAILAARQPKAGRVESRELDTLARLERAFA